MHVNWHHSMALMLMPKHRSCMITVMKPMQSHALLRRDYIGNILCYTERCVSLKSSGGPLSHQKLSDDNDAYLRICGLGS